MSFLSLFVMNSCLALFSAFLFDGNSLYIFFQPQSRLEALALLYSLCFFQVSLLSDLSDHGNCLLFLLFLVGMCCFMSLLSSPSSRSHLSWTDALLFSSYFVWKATSSDLIFSTSALFLCSTVRCCTHFFAIIRFNGTSTLAWSLRPLSTETSSMKLMLLVITKSRMLSPLVGLSTSCSKPFSWITAINLLAGPLNKDDSG